jgi:hypothetical protein
MGTLAVGAPAVGTLVRGIAMFGIVDMTVGVGLGLSMPGIVDIVVGVGLGIVIPGIC